MQTSTRSIIPTHSAPTRVCINVVALLLVTTFNSVSLGQAAVYMVRHAERADDTANSPISDEGKRRADALAKLLKRANVKAIYVSQFLRTKETAQPLATQMQITMSEVLNGDPEKTFAKLRADHPHDVVLVVGHSDTLEPLLKKWDPEAVATIEHDEFDAIFIVTPTESKTGWTRLKYAANH